MSGEGLLMLPPLWTSEFPSTAWSPSKPTWRPGMCSTPSWSRTCRYVGGLQTLRRRRAKDYKLANSTPTLSCPEMCLFKCETWNFAAWNFFFCHKSYNNWSECQVITSSSATHHNNIDVIVFGRLFWMRSRHRCRWPLALLSPETLIHLTTLTTTPSMRSVRSRKW